MQQTAGAEWTSPPELREQLYELYGLTCPPTWGPPRRPYFPTFGGHVSKVMTALGTPPMPHQRYIADVALEVDPETGIFGYREVDLSIMRQQGKTAQILGVMIHRIRAWNRQKVIYAAQTRNDARERLLDEFLVQIEAGPQELARQFRPRKGLGQEAIVCTTTRSRLGITSLREESGHGPPLDLGVIDEAFAHGDSRLEEAMSPAQLTRQMAQLWVASAAGTEKSIYWNAKRERGRELIERLWRSGLTQWPSICYIEWFPPSHMAFDDPATWWACMPALGHTITEQVVKAELEKLGQDEFERGMLNRTRKSRPAVDGNVPTAAEWLACRDEQSQPGDDLVFAWDITPDRKRGSIEVFSIRGDDLEHLEVVDDRPGTAWMVPRLLELKRRWQPLAFGVDDRGPGASLIPEVGAPELGSAGIRLPVKRDEPRRGDLFVLNAVDMARACGQIADAIRNQTLRQIGQAELDSAFAGARTRHLGETWAWARRAAEANIAPLVGGTVARYTWMSRVELVRGDYDVLGSIAAVDGQCPYCDAWALDGPIRHYDDCPTLREEGPQP